MAKNLFKDFSNTQYLLLILWISLGLTARIFPHLPNFSPMLALTLFAGKEFPKYVALLITALVLMLSDIMLSLMQNYPIFGSWTLFTYTGFLAIGLCGSFLAKKLTLPRLIFCAGSSSIAFWIWTNFGVWLMGGMYAHTFSGLISCYFFALPFLSNSMIGDLLWVTTLFGTPYLIRKSINCLTIFAAAEPKLRY